MKVEEVINMKEKILLFGSAVFCMSLFAGDICDLTLNPEARDGHTPADSNRFFTVCSSSRFEAHPSSVMLDDDKTILVFWDIQQAGPCGPAAISKDAGRTWTRIDDRIPKEFSQCYDEPKAWRFIDPKTNKSRIRVFASYAKADEYDWRGADDRALVEAMPSIMSEDDGKSWRFMPPLGADFACVVGFSGMVRLLDGSYLGVFSRGKNPNGIGGNYSIMGSISKDGGLTWEKPFLIAKEDKMSFLLPTVFRSPDKKQLCCIVTDWRTRGGAAYFVISKDEGKTWTEPLRVCDELSGSEHSVGVLADGRIAAAFLKGSQICGWIGPYEALYSRDTKAGYRAKLIHNYAEGSTAGSANLHIRKTGEAVVIAHSQFNLHRPMPAVVAMRFNPNEIERILKTRVNAKVDFESWAPFAGSTFTPLEHVKLYGPFAQELVMKDKKSRELYKFDGSKNYIQKAAGSSPREVSSKNGTYEISKHAQRRAGNAAILVWSVRVKSDCKTRLRLIASPTARCCLMGKTVLPPACSGIFDMRTAEISLKKGDNEISVMVYQPQDTFSVERGFSAMPMRVAAALELKDFSYVRSDAIGDNWQDESFDLDL
jgi:hypothetical protein